MKSNKKQPSNCARFLVHYQILLLIVYFAVFNVIAFLRFAEQTSVNESVVLIFLAFGLCNFVIVVITITASAILFRKLRSEYLKSTGRDRSSKGQSPITITAVVIGTLLAVCGAIHSLGRTLLIYREQTSK